MPLTLKEQELGTPRCHSGNQAAGWGNVVTGVLRNTGHLPDSQTNKNPSKSISCHFHLHQAMIKVDKGKTNFSSLPFSGQVKASSELLCPESFLVPVTPALGPQKQHWTLLRPSPNSAMPGYPGLEVW